MARPADLPLYRADQFDVLENPEECDIIMKGGVTSGIVYPFALLQIATRYRFRSLGGTSAGAIAAAFAAAAEYSRSARNDTAGFVRLQKHCEELPARLVSLFQPDHPTKRLVDVLSSYRRKGTKAIIRSLALRTIIAALLFGAATAELFWLGGTRGWAFLLALLMGAAIGAVAGFAWSIAGHARTVIPAVLGAFRDVPDRLFGACSGLKEEGYSQPALTDWLHSAIQDIAFGDDDQGEVLTFGHLGKADPAIDLRMVTTNLSMMRPHTLPEIRLIGGFKIDEWRQLFPETVIAHLRRVCAPWKRLDGSLRLPLPDQLPVIVATRMSLSFPLLFKAIPIYTEDFELYNIVRDLGGTAEKRIRKVWLSDGGISSNFPIHMFDSPLPTRPTFAVSLDDLPPDARSLKNRVLLPQNASTAALGVPVHEIRSLLDFGKQVFFSAKDWQDQLLSEITGQRERIAHVYLKPDEGGLNLGMDEGASFDLMRYGLAAGAKFVSEFDFDEHQWRRALAFYKASAEWSERAGNVWSKGFAQWYRDYSPKAKSYRRISKADRKLLANRIEALLAPVDAKSAIDPRRIQRNFPRKTGMLRNTPTY